MAAPGSFVLIKCINNELPQHVVEASNTNIFKTRLDKFWSDKDCTYLWKANLSGTGSRSEVLCNYDDEAN